MKNIITEEAIGIGIDGEMKPNRKIMVYWREQNKTVTNGVTHAGFTAFSLN